MYQFKFASEEMCIPLSLLVYNSACGSINAFLFYKRESLEFVVIELLQLTDKKLSIKRVGDVDISSHWWAVNNTDWLHEECREIANLWAVEFYGTEKERGILKRLLPGLKWITHPRDFFVDVQCWPQLNQFIFLNLHLNKRKRIIGSI